MSDQEPKYDFRDGRVFNRATGEAIPDDEPVFVLRGRDRHAARVLGYYHGLCRDVKHCDIVEARLRQFREFAEQHPDRMKEPDSPR